MARPPQDPQVRITEILNAAEPLFYSKGYQETSISDIVTNMGVAHGTIYYYFKSKEEILEALIQRYLLTFVSEVKAKIRTDNITPLCKIQLIIQVLLKSIYRDKKLLFEFIYNDRMIHFIDKLARQGKHVTNPLFLEIIEEGNQKNYFQTTHPLAAVNIIQAIIDSLIKEIYEKSPKELLVYQFKLAEELIDHVLGLKQRTINIVIE
ncbi:TetR/AcrR family transcriptional regulator [Sporomusa sp.]|uniref:TetR/AcrR family transcriptional regulator n=1 Tax=Sporomusa sp. TaxID=2078658 RepID=UPI002D10D4B0|nr:TetR/AcrR family transcriptional regulator [Sporomusa sp.]HWR42703.1 TetR/AcrR family transcriptional regulator [Sporomusa sp.]